MSHGKVAQTGTPREIYHQPASAFVADFIGTMNRLRGRMEGHEFVCAGGRLPWQAGPRSTTEVLLRPEDIRLAANDEVAHLAGTVVITSYSIHYTKLYELLVAVPTM